MEKPSIYLYIIFLFLLGFLIKKGYWKNSFKKIILKLKENYKFAALIILITLITVLTVDRSLVFFFRKNKINFLDWIASFGNALGDGEILFPSLTVIIIISTLFNWEKTKILFSISFMSAVYSGIAVNILKVIVSRTRPFYNSNPLEFFQYLQAVNEGKFADHVYASMPSGHTITSFALIVPFYLYFKNKYIRFFLAAAAVSTAFARVYSNVHWPSDVFMGAVLGSLIAAVIYDNNQDRLQEKV
jgi:undecaprenyl-diphosphatase